MRMSTAIKVGLLAAGVLTVPFAGSVAAATSCHVICDGVDPNRAAYEDANGVLRKCSTDARTIYTLYFEQAGNRQPVVELRYSRRCRMAWARAASGGWVHGFNIEGFNRDGSLRTSYDAGGGGPWPRTYTLAVDDAGLTARACYWYPWVWQCGQRY